MSETVTTMNTMDELIEKIVGFNTAEDALLEARRLADFSYSEGKLTFDEWAEVDDPMSAALVELRINRETLQDEVDELIVLELVTGEGELDLVDPRLTA